MTAGSNFNKGKIMQVSRRQLIKTAAWSAPVISMAIAAPATAASGPQTCERETYTSILGNWDVATIIVTETAVVITYQKAVDMIDINVHKPSGNVNLHEQPQGGVKVGDIRVIPLVDCEDPTFIQVHGNNTHYYGKGAFA